MNTNSSLLNLQEASALLPKANGKRVHTSTLWRWCRKGIKGIKLDYVRLGRRIYVERDALMRFGEKLAAKDEEAEPPIDGSDRPTSDSGEAHTPIATPESDEGHAHV